jgi:hypothetical protein
MDYSTASAQPPQNSHDDFRRSSTSTHAVCGGEKIQDATAVSNDASMRVRVSTPLPSVMPPATSHLLPSFYSTAQQQNVDDDEDADDDDDECFTPIKTDEHRLDHTFAAAAATAASGIRSYAPFAEQPAPKTYPYENMVTNEQHRLATYPYDQSYYHHHPHHRYHPYALVHITNYPPSNDDRNDYTRNEASSATTSPPCAQQQQPSRWRQPPPPPQYTWHMCCVCGAHHMHLCITFQPVFLAPHSL